MRFELGTVTLEGEQVPALHISGAGVIPFTEDETGGYVELTRDHQLALKKELD